MQDLAVANGEMDAELLTDVLIKGDLSKLTEAKRLEYYSALCKSLDLNPLTKPFEYIILNGKLTLYARRDCTEQLRSRPGKEISIDIMARETVNEVYVVTARATNVQGRRDESIGAVNIAGLKGEALPNAYMKAETKAKRRVTLSICGLGMIDESEVGSVPGARFADAPKLEGASVKDHLRAQVTLSDHTEDDAPSPYDPVELAKPKPKPEPKKAEPPKPSIPRRVPEPERKEYDPAKIPPPGAPRASTPADDAYAYYMKQLNDPLRNLDAHPAEAESIINAAVEDCRWDGPTWKAFEAYYLNRFPALKKK